MELIDRDTIRMLKYLAVLEATGISAYDFNRFGEGNPRRGILFGEFDRWIASESWADCFVRIGWAVRDGQTRLRIAQLGRSVLAGVGATSLPEPKEQRLMQVVLTKDDDLAYPKLLSAVLSLGECLLVDPYLKAEQFVEVVGGTKVDRCLIRSRCESEVKSIISTTLAGLPGDERPEVRMSDGLHDRLAIPTEGNALGFGLSLNSVGIKTTTLVAYTPEITRMIRETYSEMWERAKVLAPSERNVDARTPDRIRVDG